MQTKPRVYLDSCCFIDLAKVELEVETDEERKADVWYLQKLILAAKNDEVTLFTSTLTIAECTHVSDTKKSVRREDEKIKQLFKVILTSGQVVLLVQPDIFIAEDARNLRWNLGLPASIAGSDLIHYASAAKTNCGEFLTTEFTKKNPEAKTKLEAALGIKFARPSKTTLLPDAYLQEGLPIP